MADEMSLAEWNAWLTERTRMKQLYTARAEITDLDLAQHVGRYLSETLDSSITDFLYEDWWTWNPDETAIDPDYYAINRDGKLTTKLVEYRGPIARRIAQALRRRSVYLELPEKLVEMIGNVIGSLKSSAGEYRFDFHNAIDWREGDFADHRSCYFSSNAAARDMLAEDDFLAIRFYAPEGSVDRYYGSGKGIGRAWILFREYAGYRVPHIFNGYWYAGGDGIMNHDSVRLGSDSNSCTKLAANGFAAHLGLTAQQVYLSNCGSDRGTLYVNHGTGFVIAPAHVVIPNRIDLRTDKHRRPKPCCECGVLVGEAERIVCDYRIYCNACYAREYFYCPRCGRHLRNEWKVVSNGNTMCRECHERYFFNCAQCNVEVDAYRRAAYYVEGQRVCGECHTKLTCDCKICGCRVARATSDWLIGKQALNAPLRRGHICRECIENHADYLRCKVCGRLAANEMILVHADGTPECLLCVKERMLTAGQPFDPYSLTTCTGCSRKTLTPLKYKGSWDYYTRHYCNKCAADRGIV